MANRCHHDSDGMVKRIRRECGVLRSSMSVIAVNKEIIKTTNFQNNQKSPPTPLTIQITACLLDSRLEAYHSYLFNFCIGLGPGPVVS